MLRQWYQSGGQDLVFRQNLLFLFNKCILHFYKLNYKNHVKLTHRISNESFSPDYCVSDQSHGKIIYQ